jgi:UDP-N-acetylmuramyl tripeptide synthase
MLLHQLADHVATVPAGAGEIEIRSLSADSRAVTPGSLFAALPGAKADGAKFVAQAVAAGAVAVLAASDAALPALGVPVIRADDPRRALALLAASTATAPAATACATNFAPSALAPGKAANRRPLPLL